MRASVTTLDASGRRWNIVAYAVGLGVYILIVVGLYPAFKDSAELDKFVNQDSTAAALFGVTGTLTSSAGWLNGNIYGNFLPLIVLMVTIAYGAASLAGQDEDGTLGMVVALPLRRSAIVSQKIGALALFAFVVTAVAGLCVYVGRWFDLSIDAGNVASVSATTLLLGVDFGLLAMLAGAMTGSRGAAIGISTAVAAASFLLNSLAGVVSWLHGARYGSLFYWSSGNNQIVAGARLSDYAVLVTVGALLACASVVAFKRMDLR